MVTVLEDMSKAPAFRYKSDVEEMLLAAVKAPAPAFFMSLLQTCPLELIIPVVVTLKSQ